MKAYLQLFTNSKSYSHFKFFRIQFILLAFLFSFSSCGWAGFNQFLGQGEKDDNSLILLLTGFGLGSSLSGISSSTTTATGPLTATISPSDGGTNVSISTGISIAFNRQINASTIHSGTVYLTQGGTPVAGTLTIAGTSAAVFIPNSPLIYNTSYTLTVTTGVTDTLGPPQSLAANVTSTFTTQADSSLPTVTLVSPGNGDSNIATNANIFITFSKPMAAATLNNTNITLLNGVTPVTGTVSTFGTTGAYFTPTSILNNSTTYTINISTGVTDSIGNAMGSSYSTTFTTAAATLDTTPPTVTSSNPSNGATSVAVTQTILITFSKPIASATINSTNITLMQGVTPITGTVYAVGSNGAVFQPSSSLAYNTAYTLTLTTGITDTVSTPNALANTTISFTTILDVAPTVSLVSPGNSDINISPNTNIFITFSKSMMAATLNNTNITLLDGATPVTGTVSTFGTTGAYFTPAATLSNSKTYTVNISTGVTDLNGVAMASSYSTTFTTSAATPDITPPTVTSTSPSNGATSVSVSQTILITFSKPIASATINSTNITLMQGVTPITGTVYAVGSNGAVFQPSSALAYNTAYTLTLTTGITDTASTPNSLANTTISFTTMVDSTAFTVSSVSPSTSSTNISPYAGIIVTFNKAVDLATLVAANITLTANGNLFSTPITITPIGTSSVLILPNSPMTNFTLHTLQLTSGILDSNGNALTGTPYTSVFTTSSESGADGGSVAVISGPVAAAAGAVEGTAANPFLARYSSPRFLTWANYGGSEKLFITDTGNNRMRTLTTTGANTGLTTSVTGLTSPRGVVVNNATTELYFPNTTAHQIRRITLPSTLVGAVFAGGAAGYINATSTAALFNNPEGIAIDSTGNFYVTDQSNHVIRKITSAGVTTTLAGANPPTGTAGAVDATGAAARFNTPRGIAVDTAGNVYVTDTANHTIRRITSAGVVTTIAGSALNPGYVNGLGGAARFNSPQGIVFVPAAAANIGGMLLITDTSNHAIRMLNPTTGMVTTYAGPLPSTTGGLALAGNTNATRFTSRFNNPIGITVQPTTGIVYITDTNNHVIKAITY